MRPLTLRWESECARCAKALPIGSQALYERGCGTFCPDHGPSQDELRELRRAALDRKASRREEWAAARQRRADALLAPRPGEDDWAFITQPGHIPARAKMHQRIDRGCEEQRAANRHAGIAASLRATRALVAGDTARRRDEANERAKARVLEWIKVGMVVQANPYPQPMPVLRLNAKTVTVRGAMGDWKVSYRDIERPPAA